MRARVVSGVVLALVLAVTIVLGVRYFLMESQENARESALTAAREYAQRMYAWTPDNVADNTEFMLTVLTGEAKSDYQSKIIDQHFVEQSKNLQVVSQVTDQGSAVMESTRTTARVLLFLNTSSSSLTSQEVKIGPTRQIFTMVREGGTWKISKIQILTDSTLQDAIDADGNTTDATPVPLPSQPPTPAPAPTN